MTHSQHLRDEEFVDLLDHALPGERAAHVSACAACRDQAEALQRVVGRASEVRVPDPSPLFWDHLATRIRDGIVDPAPDAAWRPWAWRPAGLLAGMAAAVALAAVLSYPALTPRSAQPANATLPSAAPVVHDRGDGSEPGDDVEADEAWAMVRSVAEEVAWDEAHAAGISARPDAADRMILELTQPERSELARLLEAELKRPGA